MTGDEHLNGVGRRTFLQGLALAGTVGLGGVTVATPGREPGPREDEYIIGVDTSDGMATMENRVLSGLPEDAEVQSRGETLGYIVVKVPNGDQGTVSTLEYWSGIQYTEENIMLETLLTPNDPRWGSQYAPEQVSAPTAWDTTQGSSDVTVGVVDTGADYTHEDLEARFRSDPGKDFADGDNDPKPPNNEIHGTHVSGCASADTDNNTGVAGVSDSTLINARCLAGGTGGVDTIAQGIRYCTDEGADIVNLSIGSSQPSDTLKNACQYAENNGVLVMAAAGNSGSRGVAYPAAFDSCVAVSALDPNENLASFSSFGAEVEVASPGQNILAPTPGDSYEKLSGTSMASPVAAGVAALGKAAHPNLSNSELRDKLTNTAVDVGLSGDKQGSGRVDAANIVEGGGDDPDDPKAPTADFSASPSDPDVGDQVNFDASASSDPDGSITKYQWKFGDGATGTGKTVTHTYGSAGDYDATLRVTDNDGKTDIASKTITVGDGGGGGDEERHKASSEGRMWSWWDNDNWQYNTHFNETLGIRVTLKGPKSTDFDLYVTKDGSRANSWNYDKRGYSDNSNEQVSFKQSEIDSSHTNWNIQVDSYRGSGTYKLVVQEVGKGGERNTTSFSNVGELSSD